MQTIYFIFTMFFFGALEIAILFRLLIKTIEPGTPNTETLLKLMQPIIQFLDQLFAIIFYPVNLICQFIQHLLPANLAAQFPTTDVGLLLKFIFSLPMYIPVIDRIYFMQDLANTDYYKIFPGVLDWRLVIAFIIVFALQNWADDFGNFVIKFLKKREDKAIADEGRQKILKHFEETSQKHDKKQPEFKPEKRKAAVPQEVMRDLKQEIETLHKKAESASIDKLTGLLNRAEFDVMLDKAFSHCRIEKRAVAMTFMDIDNFKKLNDTYGHHIGDAALEAIGKLMKSHFSNAFCFRYGGEELAVILTDCTLNKAVLHTEAFQRKLSQIKIPEHPEITLTVSCGVLAIDYAQTQTKHSSAELLQTVDQAMYQSKTTGKDKITTVTLN